MNDVQFMSCYGYMIGLYHAFIWGSNLSKPKKVIWTILSTSLLLVLIASSR